MALSWIFPTLPDSYKGLDARNGCSIMVMPSKKDNVIAFNDDTISLFPLAQMLLKPACSSA